MSTDDAWTASSNDALRISLVTPSAKGLNTISSFAPKFTYPIFGDDEQIFGYQNLKINLQYNANDMRPNLAVTYSKKFKAVGETEAADIHDILQDYLPEVAFQRPNDFETAIKRVSDDWTPPGELATTFTTEAGTFEIWRGNLEDPAVKQLVNRVQILSTLYIEGGSFIEVDEPEADQWTIFFLYQKKPAATEGGRSSYVFAGYSSLFRFFFYQAPTPPTSPPKENGEAGRELAIATGDFDLSELPCRTRISQFLVIPPFQQKGLGPKFYEFIFQYYLKHRPTVELTVEDPNEAFDDMRDICDLHFLRQMPEFNALHIDTSVVIPKDGPAPKNIVNREAMEAVRRKAKIAPRQFARVLEMHLMSKLPESVRPGISPEKSAIKATREQKHEYNLWELMVKQRLYRHNRDTLGQLEIDERVNKLNEVVSSVEFDFARLLLKAEKQYPDVANGKRKLDEEDEAPASKKARVEAEE
ncbi:acyl-CoA N-acyltransferase [Podospora appendiculata]|uniref:Histone acetyltransferase type B catalytic subunit n=1 Tax=Podospora appendiculata TaxID=314037 RepID=A0AAE0X1G1_9PEZI|nr:acyl-CoA N-acyltransferase [Podospora appendiculata]